MKPHLDNQFTRPAAADVTQSKDNAPVAASVPGEPWSDRSTESMTLSEVACFCEMSSDDIRRAVDSGSLAALSTEPLIFLRRDVAAWLEDQRLKHRVVTSGGLTEEQVTFFLQNGFLHIPAALHTAELEALQIASNMLLEQTSRDIVDRRFVYQPGPDGTTTVLERIREIDSAAPAFRQLLGHDLLYRAARSILGPWFLIYNATLVVKMPEVGVPIPVHRDPTWTTRSTQDAVFTVAFYLDESDETNGGVHFLPGTHRVEQGRAPDLPIHDESWWQGAVCVKAAPGDAIIHNLGVIHGSRANRSSSLRRTLYYSLISLKEAQRSERWSLEWVDCRQQMMRAARSGSDV